jgi:CobQ/CobB/MinD/ParA nucleotide binding domain
MTKPKFPLNPPFAVITASKKGGTGKTHLMLMIADLLTLNGYPYSVFQADDKMRLTHMLGAKVVDLRPNPDLVMNDPVLIRKAFTPFYTACRAAVGTRDSVLLDIGADEVENTSNFLTDVEIDEDLVAWKLPLLVFVLVKAETDAIRSAAETIRRFRTAVPSAHLLLVENLFEIRHSLDQLPPNCIAAREYDELKPLLPGVARIQMPKLNSDYWGPYENAGLRYLKALALNPEEGSKLLKEEIGDYKLARRAVTMFFSSMHRALSQVIKLPKGSM